ncbi:LysR family transcriptional regulator [Bailinhaonella thermotolerans]|nr:LysR family transcriptional regulator [Bailinhaonella thermotolerans]
MNVSQLRAFVAVVHEGGFGRAAETLGISQSAVSHAIAALERAVGGPVLHRAGTPSPTALGARILPHARAVASSVAAIAEIAERGRTTRGTVRLAAPPTVCHALMPALVRRWAAEFPEVEVRLFEGEDDEVADWLEAGMVDAAVLVDPEPGRGVEIGTDEFFALVRNDHPFAGESTIDVRDLLDDPLLLSDAGCERHVLRLIGDETRPAHRIRDIDTLLQMVRTGLGVSILPGYSASMLDSALVLVPLRQRVSRRLVLDGPANRPWHPVVSELLQTTGT